MFSTRNSNRVKINFADEKNGEILKQVNKLFPMTDKHRQVSKIQFPD